MASLICRAFSFFQRCLRLSHSFRSWGTVRGRTFSMLLKSAAKASHAFCFLASDTESDFLFSIDDLYFCTSSVTKSFSSSLKNCFAGMFYYVRSNGCQSSSFSGKRARYAETTEWLLPPQTFFYSLLQAFLQKERKKKKEERFMLASRSKTALVCIKLTIASYVGASSSYHSSCFHNDAGAVVCVGKNRRGLRKPSGAGNPLSRS